jgi:hypothetical protein
VGWILGCCSCISHTRNKNRVIVPCRLKKKTHPKSPFTQSWRLLPKWILHQTHMLSVYTCEPLCIKNPDMPIANVFCPEDIRSLVREVLRMKMSDSKPRREHIRASRTCVLVLSFPCHSPGVHLIWRNGWKFQETSGRSWGTLTLQKLRVFQWLRKTPLFMESKDSQPCSQDPAISFGPLPNESIWHFLILF